VRWSPKQAELVAAVYGGLNPPPGKRHVIASGPVRSGKSYPLNHAWIDIAANGWRNADFGLVTASDPRRQAVLAEMAYICAAMNVGWKNRRGYVEFGDRNRLWSWIGNTSTAHRQVQGLTLAGGMADEAVEVHPRSLVELSARCTPLGDGAPPPVVIAYSTNPGSPSAPFKTAVMDAIEAGKRAGKVVYFGCADNPTLAESELRELELSYPEGPERDRNFHGHWTSATGAMHPEAALWVQKPPQPDTEMPGSYYVAWDPAEVGVHHALLIAAYSKGRYWVVREFRWDGRRKGAIPKAEAARKVIALREEAHLPISKWIVDSADQAAAALLHNELRHAPWPEHHRPDYSATVVESKWRKPRIVESTRAVNALGAQKRLFLSPQVPELKAELEGLTWAEGKFAEHGVEEPDANASRHGVDALRYFVHAMKLDESLTEGGFAGW